MESHVSRSSVGTLLWLLLFIGLLKAMDISHWVNIQRGGDLETGCLHNMTVDDKLDANQTFTPQSERAFLLDLYNETGGQMHWINKRGWNDSGIHHCNWFGITCYPNNTYIKWIDMKGNNLVGTPSNLWKFRNLQGMCLSRNKKLTGNMTSIVFSNMTRLRRLSLSFTEIYGDVPWNVILKLKNLEKIQICCTNRHLTGGIPHHIGTLSKLQVFSIGENNMKGKLPKSISNLTKLWFLDLEFVQLTSGDLSYLSTMTNLISLHMTNCRLSGKLPKDFGITHPNLQDIDLSANKLYGELNQSLVGLHNMEHLSLSQNQLEGLLPKSLGSLTNLRTLDLSHNYFTGFQENMKFSTQLDILYLNGNINMSCDIKHFTQALQPSKDSLRILNASKCGISGELTQEIWNMGLVIYLDLSNNSLTGVIPIANANLPYLLHLNLASNNFSCDLDPNSFFSPLKVLRYLNIQNNLHLKSFHHNFLSRYMKPDYRTVTHKNNFSCPSVQLTVTGGTVDMDPSFYDYTLCFCDEGFYGFDKYCLRCMDGGVCNNPSNPLGTDGNAGKVSGNKKNTMEIEMTILSGYWPCCNGSDDVQRLIKCNKNQAIDNEVCSPSGKCKCKLVLSTEQKLKTSCNSSCICHHGNTGRFCSKCINGYYKRGELCVECPKFHKNFPVLATTCFFICLLLSVVLLIYFKSHKRLCMIFMFVLVTTLTILHFESIIPSWFFIIIFAVWIIGLSSEGKSLQSFIYIAVFFFQSLDAMLSEAKIWPHTIILLKYKITNVFNFEVAQLTCSFSGVTQPGVAYAILLLLPVGGIFCIWSMYILGKAFCCGIKSSMCKRLTIEILLLLYFPITAKTFSALLPCVHQDGLSYLKDTPWLDCDGTSYKWLVSLGVASLVVFVIGVPACIFAPLLFVYLDNNGQPISAEIDTWLKPLYRAFRLKYRRYFLLVYLARRFLLAASLSLIPMSSSYHILTITFVLIAFIIITFISRPYEQYSQKFEFENMADILVSVILLLSFVGLASLQNALTLDYSLVWLILSLNSLIMFSCIGGITILFAVNFLRSPEAENNVQYEQLT